MNNLVIQNINNRLYLDSREVAEMTGKNHDKLLRDIRKYKETLDNNNLEHSPTLASPNFFVPASYKNSQNRDMPCYLLTRKGCDMVANKMTGEKRRLVVLLFLKNNLINNLTIRIKIL